MDIHKLNTLLNAQRDILGQKNKRPTARKCGVRHYAYYSVNLRNKQGTVI